MNEDAPTQSGDLGPMPEAEIEPGEPNPGGADALPEEDSNEPADLPPEANPAVEVKAPDVDVEAAAEGDGADDDTSEDVPEASEDADAHAAASDADPTEGQDEVEGTPGEAGAGEPSG